MWVFRALRAGDGRDEQHRVEAKSQFCFDQAEKIFITTLPLGGEAHQTAGDVIDLVPFDSAHAREFSSVIVPSIA